MEKETIQTALKSLPGNENLEGLFEQPQYPHIDLDLEETEEAMRIGREQKHFRLQRKAYYKKVEAEEIYKTLTAEELYKAFTELFKVADQSHEIKIKNLCCYFAKDKRFKGDLSKGLLFLGNIGSGKTTIMKAFQSNMNYSFRVVNMLDVSFDYKMNGEEGVKSYSGNFTKSADMYGNKIAGYCFDDIGTEEIPARHFAESKNIFAEIIQVRYNNQNLVPFNSTHATTNKDENELLQLYGSRTYDRLKEMFNLITFENGSFR